ncbi:hypothetical protein BD414DRAFT_517110 [Trametes punicea]|nr:hypothetical protein BD414DRAFT_517110 [Trametes punicea]
MRQSGSRDMEFFWLGRIPCRTVCFVGLVVGVSVWERRTVYTVDDGTAVIDCAFAHGQDAPPNPVKPDKKVRSCNKVATRATGPSFADYLLSARTVPTTHATTTKRMAVESPPPPRPVARVGQTVRIVGRIINRHDTRSLLVDKLSLCASFNEEPLHWSVVFELHRTKYYPAEELPPFIPPPLPSASNHESHHPTSRPGTPSQHAVNQDLLVPRTPGSVHCSIPSTTTTPSTTALASSPASHAAEKPQSPIRLRHPARLRTRDLTVHTLRIYVKHYMDNAPPPIRRRRGASAFRSGSPSSTSRSSAALHRNSPRAFAASATGDDRRRSEETPRPSRIYQTRTDRTPRGPLGSGANTDTDTEEERDQAEELEDDDQTYGYTLSHLRRVPELALLARRIAVTEARHQEKEERKKVRSESERSQIRDRAQPTAIVRRPADTANDSSAKAIAKATKRLFLQAIRTLFQDGSIVLWDGPIRPMPKPALDPLLPSSFSSALWKANASSSSSISESKSRSTRSFRSYDEWDDNEPLSEPDSDEEAYVPLTPAYFSRVLERAIASIIEEASSTTNASASAVNTNPDTSDLTPKPTSKARRKPTSLIERLRAQELQEAIGGAPGPTPAELLSWLRNSDERWARVGIWSVEEALEWGRKQGRLWCVGKGRWELCG